VSKTISVELYTSNIGIRGRPYLLQLAKDTEAHDPQYHLVHISLTPDRLSPVDPSMTAQVRVVPGRHVPEDPAPIRSHLTKFANFS
jgi:hypothetical protein